MGNWGEARSLPRRLDPRSPVTSDSFRIGRSLVAWHQITSRWGACLIQTLERKCQSEDAKLADSRQCAAQYQRSRLQWAGNAKEFLWALHRTLASDLLGHGDARTNNQALTKSEGRRLMAEQKTDKTEVRAMWIMVALVVLIIVAGMGWNMWTHPDWIHGN